MWKWLNPKRLRDYPRLILFSSSSVLLLNILLGHGWIGGLTGLLMWGDFLVYYAGGLLYKINIADLYNLTSQEVLQRNLIAPTVPPGVTLYSYPPNSAQLNSIFSYVSLPIALIIWCFISVFCVILSVKLIQRYLLPAWLVTKGLTAFQLSILIFSSFAFLEGFASGQTHSYIFLLIVALLIATMKEKWFLAGLFAALLTYKPQLVIGFILLWFFWKKYYAILVFILFSLIWQASVLITKGINPYLEYIHFLQNFTYVSFIKDGFPFAIQSTPYTLIASILSIKYAQIWNQVYLGFVLIIVFMFSFLAFKTRKIPVNGNRIMLSMGIILPLIISPYALLHDLLLLVPVMLLLVTENTDDKHLLILSIGVYLSMLFLPLLSYILRIALTSLIPITVFIYILNRSLRFSRA